MKKILVLVLLVVLSVFLIAFDLFLIRAFGHEELDDVSPNIECAERLYEKSDVLWIIPLYKGKRIDADKEWCENIKRLNKTLGLHGVYHTFEEFGEKRDWNYVSKGISAFENCFGFKPKLFKPPQLEISYENANMFEENSIKVKAKVNQVLHKVYHCSDSGRFSNKFIDLF